MISVTDPFTGTVEYAYDLAGNRTALTVTHDAQTTATHYTFDADNRLISVTDWATGTITYGYDSAGRLITTTLPNGVQTTHTYDDAGRLTALLHARGATVLARYDYTLDAVGNRAHVTETVGGVTRGISTTYDPLDRLIHSEYTSGEAFTYRYDPVGNRTAMTSTTPLSGTVVTTHTFDAANRLTGRAVSDGRAYTYTWSHRGQMLAEYTEGIPVRTFEYDGAGQMVKATVFTLTTEFVYNGLGARVALSVTGQTTRYTLDYAAGNRILAETTPTSTVNYLYGRECLGEFRDDEPLYYLPDGEGYVRQGADVDGAVVSAWLFDPDGVVLEGPEGLVSHLVCGGVYDWSTGLLYQNGRYFDPMLGIWLALLPLTVLQARSGRKKQCRHGYLLVLFIGFLCTSVLVACDCPPKKDTPPIDSFSSDPKCSDFDLKMIPTESEIRLMNDPFAPAGVETYGKEVEVIITPEPGSDPYPCGEELSQKCAVVQWVEGYRKVNGQFFEDMNHEKYYKPDVDSIEATYPEYGVDIEEDLSSGTVTALRLKDTPSHDLYPGQTLEIAEHFIVAVYNKEEVDRSWGLVTLLTEDEVLATPYIEKFEWNFVATYTAGTGQ